MFGLISSFLSNRRLRVVLNGKSSQEYPVNAGVPQGSNLNCLLNLNLIYETMNNGVRSDLLISMLRRTQLVSFDWSNNNHSIDMKMDGPALEEKYFLRCWLPSLLNWIGFLTLSLLLKLSPRKLEL